MPEAEGFGLSANHEERKLIAIKRTGATKSNSISLESVLSRLPGNLALNCCHHTVSLHVNFI
jgi:hypothetical protein